MIKRLFRPRVFLALLMLLISLSAMTALSAANIVPETHISDTQRRIRVNDLKPPECASLNLHNIVSGSFLWGYPPNALVLGTSAGDWILGFYSGSGGTNCILGGGSGDWLLGGNRDEILIGGPGDDSINGRGGYDICYGGGGNDTFSNCEETY